METQAKFVVFEGLDGAGTTTQINRLARWLAHRRVPCEVTSEPSHGPLGAILRTAIEGRVTFSSRTLALAFAADRLDHLTNHTNGIEMSLSLGRWVLCDRYVLSSLAYQLDGEMELDWLLAINNYASTPDVTIFIDTPTDVCLQRIDSRTSNFAIFHNQPELDRTLTNYRAIVARGENIGHLITVNGGGSEDEVFTELVAQFEPWMRRESSGLQKDLDPGFGEEPGLAAPARQPRQTRAVR